MRWCTSDLAGSSAGCDISSPSLLTIDRYLQEYDLFKIGSIQFLSFIVRKCPYYLTSSITYSLNSAHLLHDIKLKKKVYIIFFLLAVSMNHMHAVMITCKLNQFLVFFFSSNCWLVALYCFASALKIWYEGVLPPKKFKLLADLSNGHVS